MNQNISNMWQEKDNIFEVDFIFFNFIQVFVFMIEVVFVVEVQQYYFDWNNVYNKVSI